MSRRKLSKYAAFTVYTNGFGGCRRHIKSENAGGRCHKRRVTLTVRNALVLFNHEDSTAIRITTTRGPVPGSTLAVGGAVASSPERTGTRKPGTQQAQLF